MFALLATQIADFSGNLGTFQPPTDAYQPGTSVATTAVTFERILSTSIGVLTVIAGLAFLLFFLFGALQWVGAGGDSGKVEQAKTQMTNGAIGLIIVVMSYGIVAVIGQVVGLDILNPGKMLMQLGPDGASTTIPPVINDGSCNTPCGAGASCVNGQCVR